MKILVTGVSSGIGNNICEFLINNNYQVDGIDRQVPENKNIFFHSLDLSNLREVERFIENKALNFDAFIHCAGIREICNPLDLSSQKWAEIFNVNVSSAFILSKALISNALKNNKKFNIIYLASISGIQAEPDRAAYVSSKFALIGLTKQLALQFGPKKIRVNAIAPGIIETEMTQNYFSDPENVKLIKNSTPVGYWGQVEHITPLVEQCLLNDYLNGSVIVCDGGWTTGKLL